MSTPPSAAVSTPHVLSRSDVQGFPASSESFNVRTYNVLANWGADGFWKDGEWVRYETMPERLKWQNRKPLILKEILLGNPDIVCLQEVEPDEFIAFFEPRLGAVGYECLQQKKKKAAYLNAVFILKDRFECVWRSDRSRIMMMQLRMRPKAGPREGEEEGEGECLSSGPPVPFEMYLNNVHLEAHPKRPNVRMSQILSMFKFLGKRETVRVREMKKKKRAPPAAGEEPEKIPHLPVFIVGDLNESPRDGIYRFLTTGSLDATFACPSTGVPYFAAPKAGQEKRETVPVPIDGAVFSSVAKECFGEEQKTIFDHNLASTLDFIFHWSSEADLRLDGVMQLLDKDDEGLARERIAGQKQSGGEDDAMPKTVFEIPNQKHGSDHLSLFARFSLRK